MTRLRTLTFVAVAFGIAATVVVFARAADDATQSPSAVQADADWAADPIWHDGLVEKAVYDAEKVIYGHPRRYEATLLTNKEAHDPATWTKSTGGGGTEVWKFNQVEVVPTPNYDYKFETTVHLETRDLSLTRLDAASQEWCGASFKQLLRRGDGPSAGTTSGSATCRNREAAQSAIEVEGRRHEPRRPRRRAGAGPARLRLRRPFGR